MPGPQPIAGGFVRMDLGCTLQPQALTFHALLPLSSGRATRLFTGNHSIQRRNRPLGRVPGFLTLLTFGVAMSKSLSWRPLAALSLLASLAFAACQSDRNPTVINAAPRAHSGREGAAANLNAHGLAYASAQDPHVCFTSVATGGTPTYSYGRISLHFPSPALATDGATHLYIYGGRNSASEVVFIAECVIPATRTAVEWMNRRFGVVDRSGNPLPVGHAPRNGDVSTMGCVIDGQCGLEEITVAVSPLPVDNCNVAGCSTTGGTAGTGGGTGSTGGGSSSPGSPTPDDSTEVSSGCPYLLTGSPVTALIPVGGSNHEFKFETPMTKISRTSAGRYNIRPTVSTDTKWMATEGWIEVSCLGAFMPEIFETQLWVGKAWFTGASDLHMIYGPGYGAF
ncbi:MAG: hypothetical protein JWM27_4870 [Gemmatimonadetes bacterium]|nr:hypothetical protein [Gemmatimonadota bacterium]